MRRILLASACAIAFAALGLAAMLLWYLLYTTDGANLALKAASRALQGTATIDMRIKSGSLAHGFDSDGAFCVEVPGTVRVSADSFSIRYSLRRYLTTGTLEVARLTAPSLQVLLEPTPAGQQAAQPPEDAQSSGPLRVDIPVKAVVRHIIAPNFAYRSEIVDVLSEKTDLSASCGGDYAGVLGGTLEGVEVHLKYRGDGTSDPLPRVKTFGGDGIEPFETIDLPLDTEIRNLLIKRGRYHMDGFDTGILDAYVDAGWKGHLLKVKRIGISHEWGHAGLSGSMDFSRYFGMNFTLSYRGAQDEAARERFMGSLEGLSGTATIKGDLTDLKAQADNELPLPSKAFARINTLSGLFPFEAEASAPLAVWPLWMPPSIAGQAQAAKPDLLDDPDLADAAAEAVKIPASNCGLRVKDGQASLKGFLAQDLEAKASGAVSGYGLEDVKAEATGAIEEFSPVLRSLRVSGSYMGSPFKASLDGKASLAGKTVFSGKAELSSDDPHKAAPFLTGRTWASADAMVKLDEGQAEVELSDLKGGFAAGRLAPAFSAKSLWVGKEGVGADGLSFHDAAGTLTLSGLAGEQSDLTGKFDISDLSRLIPGARGAISGSLALAGDIQNPEGRIAATSKGIRLGTHEFTGITLSATADAGRGMGALTLLSEEARFAPGLTPSRKCALDVNGSLSSHSAVVSCAGRNGGFLSLSGGLDPKKLEWHGSLSDFILQSEFAQTITLGSAVPLSFNLKTLEGRAGAASLRGQGSLELSEARFSPNVLDFKAAIKALSLDVFKRLLPAKWDLSGAADGQVSLAGSPSSPKLDAAITVSGARIAAPDAAFAFDRLKLGATGGHGGITFDLDAAIKRGGGNILASLTVGDPRGAKRLSGTLKVDSLALSRLRHLGGGFNELDGTARADLRFGGTLSHPLIFGSAGASGSAEPRYDIGRVDSFRFDLAASGQGGTLNGSVGMNQGSVSLSGPLDWSDGARGCISITSRALPVLLMGYGECLADIDATATLGNSPGIKGRIFIPSADIRVSSIGESGTAPSPDEVIVGSGGAQEMLEERRAAAVKARQRAEGSTMDLTVSLGSKVQVHAMGLKALAQGEVRIQKGGADSHPSAKGQVSLVNGRADIYGHRFLVSYAESLFDGNITNPKIRAEAVADPSSMEDDVVAGVRVMGTASDPSVTLFSKPAMSQNEILSYLLYGHGLEKTPENPESSSSQLLLALGLGTTSGLMSSISDALGVGGLQFGSTGSGESTQVGVQGYLTNRIMISYGYGVFSSVGEFRLRYELMRKLYAEFISSVDQAVDLIYSFDFN